MDCTNVSSPDNRVTWVESKTKSFFSADLKQIFYRTGFENVKGITSKIPFMKWTLTCIVWICHCQMPESYWLNWAIEALFEYLSWMFNTTNLRMSNQKKPNIQEVTSHVYCPNVLVNILWLVNTLSCLALPIIRYFNSFLEIKLLSHKAKPFCIQFSTTIFFYNVHPQSWQAWSKLLYEWY